MASKITFSWIITTTHIDNMRMFTYWVTLKYICDTIGPKDMCGKDKASRCYYAFSWMFLLYIGLFRSRIVLSLPSIAKYWYERSKWSYVLVTRVQFLIAHVDLVIDVVSLIFDLLITPCLKALFFIMSNNLVTPI